MATNDEKKRRQTGYGVSLPNLEAGAVTLPARARSAPAQPSRNLPQADNAPGAKVGNLTLVPGSGANRVFRAAQEFKERYNAPPTGPKIISPDNPRSMAMFSPPHPAAPPVRQQGGGGGAVPPAAAAVTPAPAAPARPAAPGATGANFQNVTDAPRRGDPNTFTGSDGVTQSVGPTTVPAPGARRAQPLARALQPVTASPSTAPQVQATTGRAVAAQRGLATDTRADAAQFLNPLSNDAEIMRRFQISQGYGSNKGSPQARRMAGEAILGQLGARNAASAAGQQQAGEAINEGARSEAAANESFVDRRLTADRANTEAGIEQQRLAAEAARPSQVIRGLDGTTSVLRNDSTTTTLRDEAGNPVQTPAPATTALTPKDLLDSYNTQAKAITEALGATADEKAAQLEQLRSDPLYAPLFGGGAQAKPTLQEFMAAAREANPGASDADLTAFYNRKYGN